MTGKTRLVPVVVLGLAALAAWGKTPQPAPARAPAPENADGTARGQARRDSIARAEEARRDSLARAQAEADKARAAREAAMKALTQVVYFEFDSDALTDEAKGTL